MASPGRPLVSRCGHCGVQKNLLRCGGCKVVQYCSREHQAADRPRHKQACKLVLKNRNTFESEEKKLRDHPGDDFMPVNVFESSVGHFWSILETRDYMTARYGLVKSILSIKTFEAARSALDHYNDMLRLCRGDNMGVRDLVPALYLRLDRDQEAYDFVKWYATAGQSDESRPYLDVKDADAFESVESICSGFLRLNHVIAVGLLKIKLLLDLNDLQNIAVIGKRLPQEIFDYVKAFLPRSSIISQNMEIMRRVDYAALIEKLEMQLDEIIDAIDDCNPHFWGVLLKADQHLDVRFEIYSNGSLEEAQLALQYSYDSWNETPGALEWIREQFED